MGCWGKRVIKMGGSMMNKLGRDVGGREKEGE